MADDLRKYLQEIKKTNDLIVIKKKVSTKYEVASITEKLDGSKAVLLSLIHI